MSGKRSTSPFHEVAPLRPTPQLGGGFTSLLAASDFLVGVSTDYANHFETLGSAYPYKLNWEGTDVLLTFYVGKLRPGYSQAAGTLPSGLHRISTAGGALQGIFSTVLDFVRSSLPVIQAVSSAVLDHLQPTTSLQSEAPSDDLQSQVAAAFLRSYVDLSNLLN